MKEFRSTSLAEQVFEKLETDIILGVYPRGEILTELKLVEQLGVSRTPIREALRRLEQERLIEDTGKGSVVLGITEEDLVDIMDIRKHVEALATYYATLNITEEGLEELRHIMDLQGFYFSKRDIEHMREMDDMFHMTVCRFCKRTVISDILSPLYRKTRRYRRAALDDDLRNTQSTNEHNLIFEAIAARDPEKAADLAYQHVLKAKEHMTGRMKHNG